MRAAAQGLQGANLTVLDGAEGLNSVVASLAAQGMALLETVRSGLASRATAPAVVGQRVLLFHRVGDSELLECLHAETGRRFWKVAYPTAYSDRYGFSGGPRCQPISDGQSVYTLGVEGKLHCVKLATGQIVWKRDLLREFKLQKNFFGVGSTPLLNDRPIPLLTGAGPRPPERP